MIKMQKLTPLQAESLFKYIKTHNIDCRDIFECLNDTIIYLDNEKILGFGYAKKSDLNFYIKKVYISPDSNFEIKENIVKALINIADLQGLKFAYITDDNTKLLKKLGFLEYDIAVHQNTYMELCQIYGQTEIKRIFYLHIEGYFKPCTCK